MGWFAAVAGVMVAAALNIEPLNRMRTDFVAIRYVKQARRASTSPPLDRQGAITSARRAVTLAPAHSYVLETAAEVFVRAEAYAEAVPVLLRLQQLTGIRRTKQLGMCYLMTGQVEQGEWLLEQVVRAAYEQRHAGVAGLQLYATALNDVGYFYALADLRLERAKHYTEQAVGIQPLEPAFIDSLGWVYYRLGDYQQASFYLERAVRLMHPREDPELHYHLGTAYARQGRIAEARRELEKALALDPGNEHAHDELRRLRWELPQPVLVDL